MTHASPRSEEKSFLDEDQDQAQPGAPGSGEMLAYQVGLSAMVFLSRCPACVAVAGFAFDSSA
jgi:hypothetical protein